MKYYKNAIRIPRLEEHIVELLNNEDYEDEVRWIGIIAAHYISMWGSHFLVKVNGRLYWYNQDLITPYDETKKHWERELQRISG